MLDFEGRKVVLLIYYNFEFLFSYANAGNYSCVGDMYFPWVIWIKVIFPIGFMRRTVFLQGYFVKTTCFEWMYVMLCLVCSIALEICILQAFDTSYKYSDIWKYIVLKNICCIRLRTMCILFFTFRLWIGIMLAIWLKPTMYHSWCKWLWNMIINCVL